MNISEAGKLGDLDLIYSALSVFTLIMYFIIPWLVLFSIIYFIRAIKRRKRFKQQYEKQQQKIKRQQQTYNPILQNDDKAISLLSDIQEPTNKIYYKNLALNFDKNGKIC